MVLLSISSHIERGLAPNLNNSIPCFVSRAVLLFCQLQELDGFTFALNLRTLEN